MGGDGEKWEDLSGPGDGADLGRNCSNQTGSQVSGWSPRRRAGPWLRGGGQARSGSGIWNRARVRGLRDITVRCSVGCQAEERSRLEIRIWD